MNSFVASFNVVAPLFILMAIGFCIKRLGLINDATIRQMDSISFRIFLPVMLLNNIIMTDLESDFDHNIIWWGTLISLFLTAFSYVLGCLFEQDRRKRSALVQCLFRNNFMLFSASLVFSVYSKSSSAYISILPSIIIPLNNVFGILVMMAIVKHQQSLLKTIKSIVLNPFVLASFIGFFILLIDLDLPYILRTSISDVSKIATPLLFILLGADLNRNVSKDALRDILFCISIKMIVFPALFTFIIGYLVGIRGEELLILFITVITPAAIPAQVTTSEMGGDGELAGQLIVSTTAVSMIFIFLWLSLFGMIGWL